MEDAVKKTITVKIGFDPVHNEWFVKESTIIGLVVTGENPNALVAKLPDALFELTQVFIDRSGT